MTYLKYTKMRLFVCGSFAMLFMIFCGILISVLIKTVNSNGIEKNLEFVILLSRHGSRAPIFTFPTDPYPGEKYWPDGEGALTKHGRQQMYKQGKNLREHYFQKLFKEKFKQEDLHAKSTQKTRTYMSGASLLAGFFPPDEEQLWEKTLNWQPIPIWPDYDDKADIPNDNTCLRFTEEQKLALAKDEGKYLQQHQELIDYLTKHTGMTIKTFLDCFRVWDVLTCEQENGYILPPWTQSVFPDKMKPLIAHTFKVKTSYTKIMNHLLSGPLLKYFNSWIERKINGAAKEKMLYHSGHDFTMFGLLSVFGFEDIDVVQPAASLIFEFHKSFNRRTVQMFYSNSSMMETPQHLVMPKCPDPCSLTDFLKITKDMETRGDWDEECHNK